MSTNPYKYSGAIETDPFGYIEAKAWDEGYEAGRDNQRKVLNEIQIITRSKYGDCADKLDLVALLVAAALKPVTP